MKSFLKYFLGLGLLVFLIAYIFIPGKSNLYNISELLILLPLLFYIFIPKFLKISKTQKVEINLGLIFFGAMVVILIVGNISTYLISFVFPGYDINLWNSNFYFMAGILFFSIGFLLQAKNIYKIKKRYYIMYCHFRYVLVFTFLSFLGAFMIFESIGFIPFISGRNLEESVVSNSITTRLWSLCVVSSIFAFVNLMYIKKSIFINTGLLVFSVLLSLFFLIRMYPFLICVTIVLIWYAGEYNKRKKIVYSTLFLVLFFVVNMLFVDYRENGNNINAVRTEKSLNFIQRNLLYTTFNEYGQMKTAINGYKEEPQYGKTLLSIPLGFIPAPFLLPLGIVKSDIQQNNSAAIMANFLESKQSKGIRIGIMGEFFINFRFYGCFFMIFIGLLVGYIQRKIGEIDIKDWRFGMYLIIFSILLYSLIGQVNAIGSLLGFYIFIFLIIKVFSKKQYISYVK